MESTKTVRPGGAGRSELSIAGMNCSGCVRHVTDALQSVAGVASAVVSLDSGVARVRWRAGAGSDPEALRTAVEKAGYKASLMGTDEGGGGDHAGHSSGRWRIGILLGVVATGLLMAGEWIFQAQDEAWYPWAALVLASMVQFGPGLQFYRGAWNQLKAGASNMDTLVALGSTTAFGYSLWVMFGGLGGHLYFMEAAAIITLISVGHWAESRVSERASQSLKALMNLAPALALIREPGGAEKEVPVAGLGINDIVLLKPGGRIPTDGEVIEGQSAVDESMLTGESLPVDKASGGKVYAGTNNLNGRLAIRVTSVGEETALAQVIAAVQRAQNSRANIQRLGDRVSNVFVPIVVLVALATGLWWWLMPSQAHAATEWLARYLWSPHLHPTPLAMSVITAASVLIIACPCAMGLATPAAIMAGANAAARRGILIRDGVALEKAGTITAVLFDKTGTLTVGRPEVAQVKPFGGLAELDVTQLGASLARHSTHPLSVAVASLTQNDVPLESWEERRGAGLQATVRHGGSTVVVRLGSIAWLQEGGVDLKQSAEFRNEWAGQGATVLGLSRDEDLIGVFALRDQLKPGASQVVKDLRRRGLHVYLVTGDSPVTARGIARQSGVAEENVFAEVRPEEKAALVARLQQRGEKIAFVGDGINDAPALEQSDLGVAVSRASDVAREAADIILLKSEIEAVPESLDLAKATLRTIRQNLFWAFFYNAMGIPLAAMGFMSPVLCAAAMGVSDIVVIGNALRLLRWRR